MSVAFVGATDPVALEDGTPLSLPEGVEPGDAFIVLVDMFGSDDVNALNLTYGDDTTAIAFGRYEDDEGDSGFKAQIYLYLATEVGTLDVAFEPDSGTVVAKAVVVAYRTTLTDPTWDFQADAEVGPVFFDHAFFDPSATEAAVALVANSHGVEFEPDVTIDAGLGYEQDHHEWSPGTATFASGHVNTAPPDTTVTVGTAEWTAAIVVTVRSTEPSEGASLPMASIPKVAPPQIRLTDTVSGNVTWLASVVGHTAPVLTTRWPKGDWSATWTIAVDGIRRPPGAVRGSLVEMIFCGLSCWTGDLTDLDWDSGEMSADGLCREAETSVCLNPSGETTSTPDTAVDQAIADLYLRWLRRDSISPDPIVSGDSTVSLTTVSELLDAYTAGASGMLGWTVSPDRVVRVTAADTTPSWLVTGDVGARFGVSDSDYATDLIGRYLTTSSTYANVTSSDPDAPAEPRVARRVTLTARGPMTEAAAQDVLDSLLAQVKARRGWLNALELSPLQLLDIRGGPANLPSVRAGQMVRFFNQFDPEREAMSIDAVIGEASWDTGTNLITISPLGAPARDLASIIEARGGILEAA